MQIYASFFVNYCVDEKDFADERIVCLFVIVAVRLFVLAFELIEYLLVLVVEYKLEMKLVAAAVDMYLIENIAAVFAVDYFADTDLDLLYDRMNEIVFSVEFD